MDEFAEYLDTRQPSVTSHTDIAFSYVSDASDFTASTTGGSNAETVYYALTIAQGVRGNITIDEHGVMRLPDGMTPEQAVLVMAIFAVTNMREPMLPEDFIAASHERMRPLWQAAWDAFMTPTS